MALTGGSHGCMVICRRVVTRFSVKSRSSVRKICLPPLPPPPAVQKETKKFCGFLEDSAWELVMLLVVINYDFFFHASPEIDLFSYILLGIYSSIRLMLAVNSHPGNRRYKLIVQVYAYLILLLTTTLTTFLVGVCIRCFIDEKISVRILAKVASSVDTVAFHFAFGSILARFLKHDFTIYQCTLLQAQALLTMIILPLFYFNSMLHLVGQILCNLCFKTFLLHLIIITQMIFGSCNDHQQYKFALQPNDPRSWADVTFMLYLSIIIMFFSTICTIF